MSRPPAAPALAGWYVISLRPSGEHAPVRRAAAALGASTFALSTLRLQALSADEARKSAMACAWAIATSPAAVRFAFAWPAPPRPRGQRWFAPGPGTAAALRRRGVDAIEVPVDGHDSAHLLALPALREVRGKSIGLLTAPGGRDLLAPTLTQRGARVVRADVYRREPRVPTSTRLAALAALPGRSALLVSSAEAFAVLWSALDERGRASLRRRPAVAASTRLAALLARHGFKRVLTATGAGPAALLAALHAGRKVDPLR
ncbi:MAG: uroporphyrinogen-III synthase [Arenimonas sp.]